MTNEILELTKENIKDKIYIIRNQKVMLDSDLAKIYGYTTKTFNQQVQRNIDKFDDDFMFKLTEKEYKLYLKSQFVTSSWGGVRKLPYAFTEQGIYMLMTVLKGELAIKQSKTLIRIFKKMKDFLLNNNLLEINNINKMLLRHDNDIKELQESFDKLDKKELKNKLFLNGEEFSSYKEIVKILNKAKNEITIIDNYADLTLLEIISDINKKVILITNKKILKDVDIRKYNKQFDNLEIIENNTFHDRFIILDKDIIYHLGASINHIGRKTCAINIIEEEFVKKVLLDKINKLKYM